MTLNSRLEEAAQVAAEIRVGEKRIVRAVLTFVMKNIDSPRVHDQRRYIYKLWTKDLNPPPAIL